MNRLYLPLVSTAFLLFATVHVLTAQPAVKQTEPVISPPRTAFSETLAGAGLVEAKTENISIGSLLPGVVEKVHVREGARIACGQPLFTLDSRHAAALVKVRESQVASAQAALSRLEAMPRAEEVPASAARVREAQANLAERRDSLRRKEELFTQRVVTEEEVVAARESLAAMQAQFARHQADHALLTSGAWIADKAVAQAQLDHARAELAQAAVDLARLTVLAPCVLNDEGRPYELETLQVNVRPGEFLATPASQPALMLAVIAERHIRVDIDEHDIPRFRADAPATAHIRGAHDQTYPLRFVKVEPFVVPKKSLTGDSAERVDTRVLQVLYALEPNAPVYIGQQADVFVDLAARQKNTSVAQPTPQITDSPEARPDATGSR